MSRLKKEDKLRSSKNTVKPFDFCDFLYDFIQKEREKNTWIVDVPVDFTQEEVNSLVWGSEFHLRSGVLPMYSQIIMHSPTKFLKEVNKLSKINTTIYPNQ
jgi:hypothetical protein